MSSTEHKDVLTGGTGKRVTVMDEGAKFELSMPLMGGPENRDPNQLSGVTNEAFSAQQHQWADELRRADERCNKFKADMARLQEHNTMLETEIRTLQDKVTTRDNEIARLHVVGSQSTYMGVKENFDQRKAEDKILAQERQLEFLNRRNQDLLTEINEIKELVGMAESKDPTDKDRFHLKTIIRELTKRNKQMKDSLDTMSALKADSDSK